MSRRKLSEKISRREVVDMLKEAKLIDHELEVGMDRHGTLTNRSRIVGFQYSGQLYCRREVCRFISDSRL